MPQYTRNPPLTVEDLESHPLAQLERWLSDASAAGMMDPTAMTLATATPDGVPSARIVLYKGAWEGGLTFYTNYLGRKGRELAMNPRAAATFWWDRLERQVRIEGRVSKMPHEASAKYFSSRPRESQIGATISRQSSVVATREELDARFDQAVQEHESQPLSCPDYWGGYVLQPTSFEFWQGRLGRLHDRLRYRQEGSQWVIERLEP